MLSITIGSEPVHKTRGRGASQGLQEGHQPAELHSLSDLKHHFNYDLQPLSLAQNRCSSGTRKRHGIERRHIVCCRIVAFFSHFLVFFLIRTLFFLTLKTSSNTSR